MNTTSHTTTHTSAYTVRQTAQRGLSLALSTVFTVALLAATNHLATSEPSPQLVAHVTAGQAQS